MTLRWWIVPLLLASLNIVGCSDKDEGADAPKPLCIPRKTVFCRCPTSPGENGLQTCLADGSGFDACFPCDGSNQTDPGGPGGSNAFPEGECGNNEIETGEQCDDGNLDDDDACLSNCRKAKCGDGIVFIDVEECDDANDNDEDGCTSDCTIKTPPSEKCPGDPVEVTSDPAGKKVAGDYKTLQPNHEGSCGGTGRDAVFSFVAPSDGEAIVSLSVLDGAQADAVLYVRAGGCDDASKEVACTNAGGPGANELADPFLVTKGAAYHVFVDSQSDEPGGFSLRVRFRPDEACSGEGGPCEVQDATVKGQCALGTLVCSGADLTCKAGSPAAEACGNDKDDDCDGFVDNGCPCAHGICSTGGALAPDCKGSGGAVDPCIKTLCEKDEYCCSTEWDKTCVEEVLTFCGVGTCVQGDCAHPLCEPGAALASGCDGAVKCVDSVCGLDAFCCSKEWDALCVEKVTEACKISCK